MTTRDDISTAGVDVLRARASEYRAMAETKRREAIDANAVAEVCHDVWLKLDGDAHRLEQQAKAQEPALFARLERAMKLTGRHDLVRSGDGVWELGGLGGVVRVFTREPYSAMPETIVPEMPNGKDRRAALLAILAVVEVTGRVEPRDCEECPEYGVCGNCGANYGGR